MDCKPNFKKMSFYSGPKHSPGYLLWQVSTSWRSSVEAILKEFELTHPQFVIMACTGWLTRNGKFATQVMVGKMAGLDPNTTSQIIKGLEKKEWISRSSSLDARAKNVSLTSKGSEVLSYALPAVEKEDTHFFKTLSSEEMSTLLMLFQKLL